MPTKIASTAQQVFCSDVLESLLSVMGDANGDSSDGQAASRELPGSSVSSLVATPISSLPAWKEAVPPPPLGKRSDDDMAEDAGDALVAQND